MATAGSYGSVLRYLVAVALARPRSDRLVLAHRVRHLGDAYRRLGWVALAESCYLEALSIYRQHQSTKPLDLANTLRGFALLKEHTHAHQDAHQLWHEAHDLYVKVDVAAGVAESAARLAALGDVMRSRKSSAG